MTDTGPYFSRVRLRQDAPARKLVDLLMKGYGRAPGGSAEVTGHHLIWMLFSDTEDRERDFLWREMAPGSFFVLSARKPEDSHNIFEIAPPKAFRPELRTGDVLSFSLRANPVLRRRSENGQNSAKHDVVMDRIHGVPVEERAARRLVVMREAGLGWLAHQGDRAGFSIDEHPVSVDGYRRVRVARPGGAKPMTFATLDFDGELVVRDAEVLVDKIASGFGSARAFGCGLLLIRRSAR